LMLPAASVPVRQTVPAAAASTAPPTAGRVAEGRAPSSLTPPARPSGQEPAGSGAPPAAPDQSRAAASITGANPQKRETADEPGEEFDPFEHEELPPTAARASAVGYSNEVPPGTEPATDPAQLQAPCAAPADAGLTLEALQRRWQVVIEELK